MTHITCRLTAKNRDQLRNPMIGNWVWVTFTFFHLQTTHMKKRMPRQNIYARKRLKLTELRWTSDAEAGPTNRTSAHPCLPCQLRRLCRLSPEQRTVPQPHTVPQRNTRQPQVSKYHSMRGSLYGQNPTGRGSLTFTVKPQITWAVHNRAARSQIFNQGRKPRCTKLANPQTNVYPFLRDHWRLLPPTSPVCLTQGKEGEGRRETTARDSRQTAYQLNDRWPSTDYSVGLQASWCRQPDIPMNTLLFGYYFTKPSVLWRCWLGGRKGIRPVKNWVVGCWHGYLSGARCRLAYGPADATTTHCLLLL